LGNASLWDLVASNDKSIEGPLRRTLLRPVILLSNGQLVFSYSEITNVILKLSVRYLFNDCSQSIQRSVHDER
jgi:hypothetical protein